MSLLTEAARIRSSAAKFEHATPHLVSELVSYIEKLIEEIEHGNRHQAVSQGAVAQEAGRAAGRVNSGSEVDEGEGEQIASAAEGS